MDVLQWLTDMQHMYADMCRVDRRRMSDHEFANAILDNMPPTDSWEVTVTNLREKLEEAEGDSESSSAVLTLILAKIRDVYLHRNRRNPQTTAHIFTAHAEATKRGQKRPSDSSPSMGNFNKRPRNRSDKLCTNPHCGSPKGHTYEECVAYGGGSQGKYGAWWRGPWNIHLPPPQRTRANNVPPPSHPRAPANPAPVVHYAYQSTPYLPLQTAQPHIMPDARSHAPTRADNFPTTDASTSDDKSIVMAATTNETPVYLWNATLDNEVIQAGLPVLEDHMPRSDDCHHDSGANRHVFHDKSAFETYQPIEHTLVRGFGRKLSAAAVGRGTVRVEGCYGGRASIIRLTNVLHIPAARSNLISNQQLDNAGVTSVLGNGLVVLSIRGINIVGGALYNGMYKLNMKIIRPSIAPSLSSRLEPQPLVARLGPVAAAASTDQAGFCIA
jgi:hypothetical protein